MNTKIYYLYRDASNNKKNNEVVLEGEFTDEDIDRIMASLNEGEWFIPENVGLDCERFTEWDDQEDHIYFELYRDDFELTDEKPTETWDGTKWRSLTVKELVERFEAAAAEGWTAILM